MTFRANIEHVRAAVICLFCFRFVDFESFRFAYTTVVMICSVSAGCYQFVMSSMFFFSTSVVFAILEDTSNLCCHMLPICFAHVQVLTRSM